MLIWKFFRMVWTTHAEVAAPVFHWTIPPDRFTGLHPRLTDLTPRMIQTLFCGERDVECATDQRYKEELLIALLSFQFRVELLKSFDHSGRKRGFY